MPRNPAFLSVAVAESEFVAIPLDTIPTGVALPFALFLKINERYVKFRSTTDSLSGERLRSLRKKVDTLFIPRRAWEQFVETMEKHCDLNHPIPAVAAKNVRTLLLIYSQHMEQETILQRRTVSRIRVLAYQLVDIVVKHPDVAQKLLVKCKDGAVYFCTHNVNVAVYSVLIGMKLGMTVEDLQLLAFSCLMHNVGNMLVPNSILYSDKELTEPEWDVLKKHTRGGAELLSYADCPTEAIEVARQHHEKMDGTGYPYGLRGEEIHVFARICAIADAYDALTSHRPGGRVPVSGKDAIRTMRETPGHFDPKILAAL